MIKRYSTWNCADWGTEEAKEGDEWPLCVSGADYDALAAELAQWKNDNLEIAGKFTKANYRIRDLEAALKEAVMYDYGDDYPPWFEKARALVGFS